MKMFFEKGKSLTAGDMDSLRPQGTLNYILYDEQMNIVPSASGSIQVNGEGEWSIIGTDGEITIPVNGYLVIYLGNRSFHEVYFDNLLIKMRKGKLLEETHYYPHGLPMGMMGTSSVTTVENRHKHQGNEYKKELGLNWMDFGFRQYDPQIGRFLGVDPLADYYGQDRYSPYAAMGNQPESMIDPNGLSYKHTFTSITGLEAPGLPSETMESLERVQRLSFLKFEDHESYALFQSLGASGGDGNTQLGYSSESQHAAVAGSVMLSFSYGLLAPTGTGAVMRSDVGVVGNGAVNVGEEKVNGITVLDYPENGYWIEKTGLLSYVAYDLASFEEFYEENSKKFPATYISGQDKNILIKDIKDIEYENKSVILYSEAGSFLSAMKYPYFTLISVGTNTDASKKGHSGAFNKIYQSDMFVPANKSSATIHTHPDAGLYFYYNMLSGAHGVADAIRGPTRNHDYPMPGAPYRNVVVDDRYIYLINHDSRQNIIIRRPGK